MICQQIEHDNFVLYGLELKYNLTKKKRNLNWVKSESTVHLLYTAPLNVVMKLYYVMQHRGEC